MTAEVLMVRGDWKGRAARWGVRALVGVAFLSAFSQGAVIGVCMALARTRGQATVLHRATQAYDVAAWNYPMRGGWGMPIAGAQLVTILAAMVLAASRDAMRRRSGLVLMAGWGAFWAWRIGRVAWVTRDWTDAALAGLAAAMLACQVFVAARWWSAPAVRAAT